MANKPLFMRHLSVSLCLRKMTRSPQSDLTSWILTLLSGQPNDDNHHCVGLCRASSGEWCDNSCSYKLHLLCEGTENQIAKNMVQIQNNFKKINTLACPGNGTCSNQGICDVSNGFCVCNSGFQGDMCQGKSFV